VADCGEEADRLRVGRAYTNICIYGLRAQLIKWSQILGSRIQITSIMLLWRHSRQQIEESTIDYACASCNCN
jgi:hypothetical protein